MVRTSTAVWALPSVLIKDAGGLPINGATVTFAVTQGGGTIGASSVLTNASGIAALASWTTGAVAATNTVTATVAGLPAVTFTAVATEPADGKSDVLAGAVAYGGTFPAPAKVSYMDAGTAATVNAFPGQVTLFAVPGTSEVSSNALIRNAGGLILAQAPQMGYYLVGTTAGGEGTFISTVSADARTALALPHLTTVYGARTRDAVYDPVPPPTAGPTVTVIDDCSGPHGTSVVGTVAAAGGGTATCLSDASSHTGTAALGQTIRHLLKVGATDGGTDRLVNLSTYGTAVVENSGAYPYNAMLPEEQAVLRRQWLGTFKNFLLAVSSLPQSARRNLVVGICAGNNNAPITPLLTSIRTDPKLGPILARHVLVVGATDFSYAGANDAPGEPDFVKMPDASSNVTSEKGCSFATPRALVTLQQVIATTGVDAADALLAAKEAAAANADNQRLVTAEAVAKGRDIAYARSTNPAAAGSVTAIQFTAWGGVNRAVITPAIAGVTVSFTVSGTDGYFDSGRLATDASGAVTFEVPAGKSGVVDTITVTVVLTGARATRQHTWP